MTADFEAADEIDDEIAEFYAEADDLARADREHDSTRDAAVRETHTDPIEGAEPEDTPIFDERPVAATPLETIASPAGQPIDIRYELVDLDDLVASNAPDGTVNPDFPQEFQPRDRSRRASIAQINNIAANLRPELLGRSPTAADGAPVIGPDNVVESGNARVLALRVAGERGTFSRYQEFLRNQGFDPEGDQILVPPPRDGP